MNDAITYYSENYKGFLAFLEGSKEEYQTVNKSLKDLLMESMDVNKKLRLLDIGCGQGAHISKVLNHFPLIHYTGIDSSKAAVSLFKERFPNNEAYESSFELFEPQEKVWDVVMAVNSLLTVNLDQVRKKVNTMIGAKGLEVYCLATENCELVQMARRAWPRFHGSAYPKNTFESFPFSKLDQRKRIQVKFDYPSLNNEQKKLFLSWVGYTKPKSLEELEEDFGITHQMKSKGVMCEYGFVWCKR